MTIEVVGNAFLRQMVRRMVAALLRVGHGRATVADVKAALADTGRPAFDGDTAPAHGLVLWRVTVQMVCRQQSYRQNYGICLIGPPRVRMPPGFTTPA